MSARRCSICSLDFPTANVYKRCPQCGEATTRFGDVKPMPTEEAERIRLFAKFEEEYGPVNV